MTTVLERFGTTKFLKLYSCCSAFNWLHLDDVDVYSTKTGMLSPVHANYAISSGQVKSPVEHLHSDKYTMRADLL